MKAFIVKTVNGLEILASLVKDGLVAVKPICSILELAYEGQKQDKQSTRFRTSNNNKQLYLFRDLFAQENN